eukprot:jgi/Botrbrau1/9926/Bobra.0012s0024.1
MVTSASTTSGPPVEHKHEHQVALVVLVYLHSNGLKSTAASFKTEAQHLLKDVKRVPKNIRPLSDLISEYIRLKETEQACHEFSMKHPPLGEILNIIYTSANKEKHCRGKQGGPHVLSKLHAPKRRAADNEAGDCSDGGGPWPPSSAGLHHSGAPQSSQSPIPSQVGKRKREPPPPAAQAPGTDCEADGALGDRDPLSYTPADGACLATGQQVVANLSLEPLGMHALQEGVQGGHSGTPLSKKLRKGREPRRRGEHTRALLPWECHSQASGPAELWDLPVGGDTLQALTCDDQLQERIAQEVAARMQSEPLDTDEDFTALLDNLFSDPCLATMIQPLVAQGCHASPSKPVSTGPAPASQLPREPLGTEMPSLLVHTHTDHLGTLAAGTEQAGSTWEMPGDAAGGAAGGFSDHSCGVQCGPSSRSSLEMPIATPLEMAFDMGHEAAIHLPVGDGISMPPPLPYARGSSVTPPVTHAGTAAVPQLVPLASGTGLAPPPQQAGGAGVSSYLPHASGTDTDHSLDQPHGSGMAGALLPPLAADTWAAASPTQEEDTQPSPHPLCPRIWQSTNPAGLLLQSLGEGFCPAQAARQREGADGQAASLQRDSTAGVAMGTGGTSSDVNVSRNASSFPVAGNTGTLALPDMTGGADCTVSLEVGHDGGVSRGHDQDADGATQLGSLPRDQADSGFSQVAASVPDAFGAHPTAAEGYILLREMQIRDCDLREHVGGPQGEVVPTTRAGGVLGLPAIASSPTSAGLHSPRMPYFGPSLQGQGQPQEGSSPGDLQVPTGDCGPRGFQGHLTGSSSEAASEVPTGWMAAPRADLGLRESDQDHHCGADKSASPCRPARMTGAKISKVVVEMHASPMPMEQRQQLRDPAGDPPAGADTAAEMPEPSPLQVSTTSDMHGAGNAIHLGSLHFLQGEQPRWDCDGVQHMHSNPSADEESLLVRVRAAEVTDMVEGLHTGEALRVCEGQFLGDPAGDLTRQAPDGSRAAEERALQPLKQGNVCRPETLPNANPLLVPQTNHSTGDPAGDPHAGTGSAVRVADWGHVELMSEAGIVRFVETLHVGSDHQLLRDPIGDPHADAVGTARTIDQIHAGVLSEPGSFEFVDELQTGSAPLTRAETEQIPRDAGGDQHGGDAVAVRPADEDSARIFSEADILVFVDSLHSGSMLVSEADQIPRGPGGDQGASAGGAARAAEQNPAASFSEVDIMRFVDGLQGGSTTASEAEQIPRDPGEDKVVSDGVAARASEQNPAAILSEVDIMRFVDGLHSASASEAEQIPRDPAGDKGVSAGVAARAAEQNPAVIISKVDIMRFVDGLYGGSAPVSEAEPIPLDPGEVQGVGAEVATGAAEQNPAAILSEADITRFVDGLHGGAAPLMEAGQILQAPVGDQHASAGGAAGAAEQSPNGVLSEVDILRFVDGLHGGSQTVREADPLLRGPSGEGHVGAGDAATAAEQNPEAVLSEAGILRFVDRLHAGSAAVAEAG